MASSFSPSPAELALVTTIFAQADPQKLGVITGDVAVRIFGGAKLSPTVLGEIWSIADEDNKGWLPKKGVAVAVRLMGWAQKGEKVTPALVNKPGPLPVIEGVTPVVQHNTGMSMPMSPPPSLPPLTPQDKAKFLRMFQNNGPENGLLSGDKARDIFVKSKLSVDKLLQIWNLADTHDRGALDSTDFTIGMYLIQGLMTGQLSFIPSSLPPSLYQQAGGNTPGHVTSHATGASGSFSPVNNAFPQAQSRQKLQPQSTGQSQLLQADNSSFLHGPPHLPNRPKSMAFGASAFSAPAQPPWDVTPAEKASADAFFDKLDTQKRGYIEGDVAVPFMLESKLPGEDLAQVWDLSDINGNGLLTRDGFAVAMHLIQRKLAGFDIPATLPPTLVPPSMRNNANVNGNIASPFAPAVSPAPPPQEPQRDLFSWDDTPPQSATLPQPTGSTLQSQQTGYQPNTFSSPAPSHSQLQQSASHDPFGSSSAFGNVPTSNKDLLSDDDDVGTTSPPLHDRSAEIGNVQIQLNSTNRSLDTTKLERANVEQALANQAAQLSALQTQLSSAKAAYETETKLLSTLHERHSGQTAEIQKAREELIRAESDLSAMRVEKAEVEGSFLRDKEEARELHRKMVEAGQQAEIIKLEVERLKKEAKQQKGLLAIARKQLSTKEAERVKAEKEFQEVKTEVDTVSQEREEAEAELAKAEATALPSSPDRGMSPDSIAFAVSTALPVSPDPSSPSRTSSILGKSNNPFERLVKSPSIPRSQSPFLPFSDASSILTPPVPVTNGVITPVLTTEPAEATSDDPFGFAQAFEAEAPAVPAEETSLTETGSATPKAASTDASPAIDTSSPTSVTTVADSDYSTPLTTAGISPDPAFVPQNTVTDASEHIPAVDATEPPLSPDSPTVPGHFPEQQTDLTSQLKELDVEDSDSDSDDEVPLAELANKGKAAEISAPTTNGNGITVAPANDASFDDVFGVSSATPGPTTSNAPEENKDAFGAPVAHEASPFSPTANGFDLSKPETVAPAAVASTVSGVNAFDEAMGKIPSSPPAAAPNFAFDSAFDDNFDFASATGSSFPPAPTAATNGNAGSVPKVNNTEGFDSIFNVPSSNGSGTAPAPRATSFDDVFGTAAPPATIPAATQSTSSSPHKPNPAVSFDEAFSGFEASPSLNLDNSFSSKASAARQTAAATSPVQKTFPPTSGPNSSQPPSPRGYAPPVSPPPRQKSPVPRVSSPKQRPSTASSSKDGHEKAKEPPVRHSKLSIRLPFGRKKKHDAPPPPPPASEHLTPPREVPSREATPAVSDDVEPVKQLAAMGFSRTEAVAALEKSGYDVQKALNSLLETQQ